MYEEGDNKGDNGKAKKKVTKRLSSSKIDFDEEEALDTVPLNPVSPLTSGVEDRATHRKTISDITGFGLVGVDNELQVKPHRYRSVSDAALMIYQHSLRRNVRQRQFSTSDVVTKNAYVPGLNYDDLHLAEQVQEYGTRT